MLLSLFPSFIVLALFQQHFVGAISCTKQFGPSVNQTSYDCCIELGGKPTVTTVGCSSGQCKDLTCDLPEAGAKKWDCYSGPYGSYSNCLPFKELKKTCTEFELYNGKSCPFTNSTKNM